MSDVITQVAVNCIFRNTSIITRAIERAEHDEDYSSMRNTVPDISVHAPRITSSKYRNRQ